MEMSELMAAKVRARKKKAEKTVPPLTRAKSWGIQMNVKPVLAGPWGLDHLVSLAGNGGECRREDSNRGEQGNRIIAQSNEGGVQWDVLFLLHVHGVSEDQSPPGAGVPGVLSECLQPDSVVEEGAQFRSEQVDQPLDGTGQRNSPNSGQDNEAQENWDEEAICLFNAVRHTAPDHPSPYG